MTQLRLFDGQSVDTFKAKLGSADIDDVDADAFSADSELILVLRVTVDGASVKRQPTGDWQRTNNLTIQSLSVATGVIRNEIITHFGFDDQLNLPMDVSSLGANPTTGEVHPRDPALASFLNESDR